MNPRLPGQSRRGRAATRSQATWLALAFVLGSVIGFVALLSMVMPQFALIFLVLAGLCFFIAFHYFTWGRWLIAKANASSNLDSDDRPEDSQ